MMQIPSKIESKRLEDGRGGLFFNGNLLEIFPTELESDEAGIGLARALFSLGIAKQVGQAYRDEQPYEILGDLKS
jgi:hypothetical protein